MSEVALAFVATSLASIPIGVSLWALLDAAHHEEWTWALLGRRRVAWMAAILFGTLTVIGGLVISSWYLNKVRPALRAAERGDLTGL
jgi:uncharacterized membrane protein